MTERIPPHDMLVAYAAGNLPEPLALLVATQASLNTDARRELRLAESVGGTMLSELEPAPMGDNALDTVMARIDGECGTSAEPAQTPSRDAVAAHGDAPPPLRQYIGSSEFEAVTWHERGGNIAEHRFLTRYQGYRTRLMRIGAGAKVPSHTHEGSEYTLVLSGGFSDAGADYSPGDLAIADARVVHQPVAWPEQACICLTVLDGPVRLKGPLGRVLNFFVDF